MHKISAQYEYQIYIGIRVHLPTVNSISHVVHVLDSDLEAYLSIEII